MTIRTSTPDFVVQDQIRGIDIYIPFGPVNEVQVHRFTNRFAIERVVRVGLYISVAFHLPGHMDRRLIRGEILIDAVDVIPHRQKHDRKVPDGISPKQDSRILPVPVLLIGIDIFVRQVDAAGEAGVAVDNADFSVIPIIEAGG